MIDRNTKQNVKNYGTLFFKINTVLLNFKKNALYNLCGVYVLTILNDHECFM